MAKKTPVISAAKLPRLVVGVGASAGGVSAIRRFLANLGDADNTAYVLIQHLNEAGAHLAHDLLSGQTKLKVVAIKDGERLRPGTVFHSPSHSRVLLKNGVFKVDHASQRSDQFSVIDTFFRSLAEDQAERAVGIVLSGGGNDGALGLKAISDAGGMTIAQLPESAESPSMPESAIATGAVDHTLMPEEMPGEISSYSAYLSRLLKHDSTAAVQEQIKNALNQISDILLKATRHDFRHYKASTLVRRIQRRMQVLQMPEVSAYIDQLRVDAKEVDSLFKELLINVTSFFRDASSFETLKEDVLLKALKARKADQKYRIWVAGCSTGEEVYTIAILVREILAKLPNPPEVQIIATDIDEAALNIARRGSYPVTIAEHVSAARLKKFFVKKSGRYVVTKDVREIVLFSSHNLINDPPFSQLDLISCRNVLIYLGAHLQKKLIPVFHYALRPGGFLFLGSSESLTSHKELFRTVSAKHRIGQRKATAIRAPGFTVGLPSAYVSPMSDATRNHEADVHLVSQRIVLDEFAPKYAVVNDDCQIVSVSSGIAQYLDPSEGSFQNNLLKLVKPSLRVGLRAAFTESKKIKRQINHEDSTLKIDNKFARIGITVQPMPQLGDEASLFMVVFQYFGSLRTKDAKKTSTQTSYTDTSVVEQLERELTSLRGDLDRTVQDLEASNEELKSSNEELLSMNEELQSANEELETSKEDVQSANDALQRTNNDLENLLSSTEIATLFLDDDLNIKSFTPQLSSIYNISKVDTGRPITDITNQVKHMPPLPRPGSIEPGVLLEQDIETTDGRWVLRRISSYRTTEGLYSGMVVTFIDVTHLRVAEERYRQLADSMPQIVWTSGTNGKIDYYNARWYEFSGSERGNKVPDGSWKPFLHPEDIEKVSQTWFTAIKNGTQFETEFRFWDKQSSSYRWFLGRAVPVRNAAGEISKWYGSCIDIHDRVMAEELRRESERRFQIMADSAPVLVWIAGTDKVRSWFNKGWLEWTGRSLEQEVNDGWMKNVHPEDLERFQKNYAANFDARREFYSEYRLRHHSGEFRWISSRGVPRFTSDGSFEGFIGGCMDIHDQRVAQDLNRENQKRLSTMIRTSPSFMCIIDANEMVFEEANDRYLQLIGRTDIIGKTVLEVLPEVAEQGFIETLRQVRDTGVPFVGKEVPVRLQIRPGHPSETRYLDFVYQPDDIRHGRAERIFVHGNDVTEKVMVRATVENERENFRNLFKQTPEMVCIMSGPEHRFEFVNEAHERALGFNATGQTVREAQPESVEVHGLLDDVYRTGVTAELNEIPVTLTGRVRYFNLTYAARHDTEGNINGVMILGTEISNEVTNRIELKEAKDDAERARRQAEAANESKTRFLANMSHEIRTPLAAILGFSELLRGRTQEGDADAAAQLDRISRNATQLGRLIDELLDLSKIEAAHLEVEHLDFDLLAALEDVLSSVSLLARQKGLQFEHHASANVPRFINTDSTRFKQILTNVIGNAVKFTESGRVDVSFEKTGDGDQQFLNVRVKDTGIGLSPDQQAKIFEPFVQADASVTRKYGGTGLGLVLSRQLARLLGGDLILEESALGQGSTFLIKIRIATAKTSPNVASADDLVRLNRNRKALTGRTILVVDDSPDNQTIIGLFVRAVGGEVEIANNGLEAVEKMKERAYDVVLMDIQMPVMDGYQALKTANQSGYRGPIVALTAHAMKEEKDRALAAGFTDYMSKPIDRNLLIAKICELILKN